MTTEQPLLCPACDRPPTMKTESAGRLRRIYILGCNTEGCEFDKVGIGMFEEGAIKSWNRIVQWTKEKYQI